MTNTIANWTATRSGASITVYGDDENGRPTKVANVLKIMPNRCGAVALTRGGDTIRLFANMGALRSRATDAE